VKNMANRIAALEGRQSAAALGPFPIYIMAAGVPEDRVVGIMGAGIEIDREPGETVDALKDRAAKLLGEKPSLPAILSYKYADTEDTAS
jgi:hypothetical protein